jgi:hydrogenase-4 component B
MTMDRLMVFAILVLWLRARANGLRRAIIWDCGYAAPTTRMQYTDGSFSALAFGWFPWVLQPQRQLRWPRGLFPHRADHVARIPETVLERAIGPVSDVVMAAWSWVRQRRQGHLADYILNLVAGLAAV